MRTRKEQEPALADAKGSVKIPLDDPNYQYRHFEKGPDRDMRLARLKDKGYGVAMDAHGFLIMARPKADFERDQEAARRKSIESLGKDEGGNTFEKDQYTESAANARAAEIERDSHIIAAFNKGEDPTKV